MEDKNVPGILNKKPNPTPEVRIFHKTPILGWAGHVDIGKIQGWAANRRIDLFRRRCEDQYGRLPTDEEIYNFMVSDQQNFHIRELARSVSYNGVRVSIILASDGTLLDGNRRYVSVKYAIANNPNVRDDLSNIPAWVMSEDVSEDQKQKVLVECNFLSDWKIDWPNYIKSSTVYEAHVDEGLNYDELTERFGLKKTEIRKMIRVMELIYEYINFNDNDDAAFNTAYEHYPYFEEAHNKFRSKLDSDVDFKDQFFAWMNEDKFRSIQQVRRLGEIRDDEEAWATIRSDHPDAVDKAIHIVQGKSFPDNIEGEKKIKKIIKQLEALTEEEIASIGSATLGDLRINLKLVIAMAGAAHRVTGKAVEEKNGEPAESTA